MGIVAAALVLMLGVAQVDPPEAPVEPAALEPIEEAVDAPLLEPADAASLDAIEEREELAPLLDAEVITGVRLKYPPGTVLYVDATSLALRTGPKRDSVLVHYMKKDARVVALDDVIEPVPETIGSREGIWIYIQHGQHKGYTFDAYLVMAPPSMQETLDWLCEPGKRVGPITAQSTYEDLVAFFGESNVRDASIPVGDGKTERGSVIFADDPERRLFIQWKFQKVQPQAVIIEGTRWRTTKGIGIGTRLSEIVRANDAPISFAGFGWDYAGYVMSWRGGALEADHVLRDDLSLFLAPQQPYLPDDYEAFQGDREFSSEMPEASKLNLRVSALTIMLHE